MKAFPCRSLIPQFILCLSLLASAVSAQEAAPPNPEASILQQDLKEHVGVLAADALEGRGAGSQGSKAAGAYLLQQFRRLKLEPAGTDGSYLQEFGQDYRNLLGVIPGSDPLLKSEYILVGAHYDHVGFGLKGQGKATVGLIHNGADDNASGCAALLELAEAWQQLEPRPRRSVLFALWDAEEIGLLGSTHWTKTPTVPLEQVKLAINLDMLGRLREDSLEIYGTRTAAGQRGLISRCNTENNLRIKFSWDSKNDSDHYPFYVQQVPYLMFFTGLHPDYHKPGDDVQKINFAGTEAIARLIFRVLREQDRADALPGFRRQSQSENDRLRIARERLTVPQYPRLGAGWDSKLAEQNQFRLNLVAPGGPAATAGLRPGDVLTSFAGHAAADITSLHQLVLSSASPVTVKYLRDGQERETQVTLSGPPVKLGISWLDDDAEPGAITLTQVTPGSAAHEAGLRAWDRLIAIDGQSFATEAEFLTLAHQPHNPLPVTYERQGQIKSTEIKFLYEVSEK